MSKQQNGSTGKSDETPKALQAFEDYWGLGPRRSIDKLLAMYREQKGNGKEVPTTRRSSVAEWSTVHKWQERCRKRIDEQSEALRAAMSEHLLKKRMDWLDGVSEDIDKAYKEAQAEENALFAIDATSLDRMTKLAFDLAGVEGVPQRVEHTGEGGGPVKHEHTVSALERLAETVARLAEPGEAEAGDSNTD